MNSACTSESGSDPPIGSDRKGVLTVSATELYVVFRDIPIHGCVSTVLGELLSLGCWSRLSFCQEILELIPVLCLQVEW